jgi:membrane-associated phospholipid phosphatase
MPSMSESVPVHTSRILRFRWAPLLVLAGVATYLFGMDEALVRALHPEAPGPAESLARWVQEWSTRLLLLAAFGLFALAWLRDEGRGLRTVTTSFIAAWVVVEVVVGTAKRLIGRPRPGHPEGMFEALRPLYETPDLKSMPSGHVAVAMCGAVFLAATLRSKMLRTAAFAFVVFVAWGRVALGAHYPSDVLVGAGLSWFLAAFVLRLGLMNQFRFANFRPRPREILAGVIALVLSVTWLLGFRPTPTQWANAGASAELEIGLYRPLKEVLWEPWTGPAAALAELPDLRLVAPIFAAWGLTGLIFFLLRSRRRALLPLLGLFGWAGVVVLLAFSGRALGDRLLPPDSWRIVETQAHLGDAYDGRMELESGRARYRELGVDAVLNTWHRAIGPALLTDAPDATLPLVASEWSAGDPAQSALHLLVYLPEGVAVPALEGDDWRALIAPVDAAGGAIHLSHPWRGEEKALPDVETAIAAQFHGGEVGGRNPEWRAEPRRRQREWREGWASAGRVRLAGGDFHGRRSAASALWLVRSDIEDWSVDRAGAAREILEGLRGERPSVAVTLGDRPPPSWVLGWAEPIWFGLDYLRGMSVARRGAWLLWLALFVGLGRLWDRRRSSPGP